MVEGGEEGGEGFRGVEGAADEGLDRWGGEECVLNVVSIRSKCMSMKLTLMYSFQTTARSCSTTESPSLFSSTSKFSLTTSSNAAKVFGWPT